MESTGIPISSEAGLLPDYLPGRGFRYRLRWKDQVWSVDPAPGGIRPEDAGALFTTRPEPVLPEGIGQIPFPEERPRHHFLRAGDLLFVGAAADAVPDRGPWLALRLPREVIVLSSDLPPMTLGAFLDRRPAAS